MLDSIGGSSTLVVAVLLGSGCYSPPNVLDLLDEGDGSSSRGDTEGGGTDAGGVGDGEGSPNTTSGADEASTQADAETNSPDGSASGQASAEEGAPDASTGSGMADESSGSEPDDSADSSDSDGACVPECGDRVCGVDTECGRSCGSCDPGAACLDEGLWCGLGVGNTDDFGFSGNINPNVLFGYRITVAPATTLRRFGVISGGTGTARLALYAHDGTGPSTLVASSSPLTLAPGNNHIDVDATPLAAGTYWLGILLQSNGSLRRTGAGDNAYEMFYAVMDYSDPFPANLGTEELVNDFFYNLYIVVESD